MRPAATCRGIRAAAAAQVVAATALERRPKGARIGTIAAATALGTVTRAATASSEEEGTGATFV